MVIVADAAALLHSDDFRFGDFKSRRQWLRIRTERGGKVKVVMELMRGGWNRRCCNGAVRRIQLLNFSSGALVHFDLLATWSHALGQEEVSPGPRQTNAFRNARQEHLQRGAGRVRQNERSGELFVTQFLRDGENTVVVAEGQDGINRRVVPPEIRQLGVGEEGDVGIWFRLAQSLQRRRGHHGVAQPVDAAHQDFLLPAGAVEVKTTSGKAPHVVRIASERQLDGRGLPALYLRHLALAVREGAGETLPAMVASLRARFVAFPRAAEEFEDGLLAASYRDADAWRYEARGYALRETNDFAVRGRFPRLTESDLPAGIGEVRYALSLDACRAFLLAPGALLSALTAPPQTQKRRSHKPIP